MGLKRVIVSAALLVPATVPGTAFAAQDEGSASTEAADAWGVRMTRVTADLGAGDGSAEVAITYEIVPLTGSGAEPPAEVPFELLGFADATASEVTVSGLGTVELDPTAGSHRSVLIPMPVGRPPGTPAGAISLAVRYRVEQAVERVGATLRGRVPVLTGPAPPPENGGDGFAAELRLPEGWTLREGFPTGLRRSEDGVYRVVLPAVPAMLGFRAGSDGGWRPGFPLLIDALTLTILLGFAAYGWMHLRGVVARGAAP